MIDHGAEVLIDGTLKVWAGEPDDCHTAIVQDPHDAAACAAAIAAIISALTDGLPHKLTMAAARAAMLRPA